MLARLRLGAAATAAMMLAGAAQAGMAEGDYECWAYGDARMGLNVAVTGPTSYTAAADGSTGEYALDGTAITWKSGLMQGAMPDGFKTVYEVRAGTPTISYVGTSGFEAAFCEHAGGAGGR